MSTSAMIGKPLNFKEIFCVQDMTIIQFFAEAITLRPKIEDMKPVNKEKSVQTIPSTEAEAKRVVNHWHIDNSVISPSCLPTN